MSSQVLQAVAGLGLAIGLWALGWGLREPLERMLERRNIRPDAVVLVSRVFYGMAIGVAILTGLAVGTNQPGLGLTGFVTAAIVTSLGLQDLFKNYVAGYYVLLERNVKVGDVVETQGYKGTVTEVRMRVTYLRGEDGDLIVVPNSQLFSNTLAVSTPGPAIVQPPPENAGQAPPEKAPKPPARRRARKLAEGAQDDPDQGLELPSS